MNKENINTFMIVSQFLIGEIGDAELRLTIFLIGFLTNARSNEGIILREELLNGYESFDEYGKCIFKTSSTGLDQTQLTQAIKEVKNRGIITINDYQNNQYLISLNIKKNEKFH